MIIVTSGHVDHGKTALLQALTGVSTAHLPEEKKRGMTIDLGYAYLPIGERVLGFIDVPGHERFLPNMLAGLGGIHYAMLIVAADEGMQAQTREHLAILRLLPLKRIIPVITKADKASAGQIDLLKARLLGDYPFLADGPCFVTSAAKGQGIDELRRYLSKLPNLADQQKPFRYAIDRIFTVKGAGTVVTGTAFAGRVNIDDELYLSNGNRVRVKNIHAQNRQSETGLAGQRLALNITGDFDREQVTRGDWLFAEAPPAPTERITVQLRTETSLTENQPVHIYHAAARTVGKLGLLDAKAAGPNQTLSAEIILQKPLFLTFGDTLILRSGDNQRLIAGAQVLEINSPKRHKRSETRLNFLENLRRADNPAARIALYLQEQAVSAAQLRWAEQLTDEQLDALLTAHHQVRVRDWCFNDDYQAVQSRHILDALAQYHAQHGDQLGPAKARLYRIAAIHQPEKLIYYFIDQLISAGRLQQTRGWLHLPGHKLAFSADEEAIWALVRAEFAKSGGQPLWVRDLADALARTENAMRDFMYKAGKLGLVMPIVKDRFFLTETVYQYAALIKSMAGERGEISVNQLRDALQFGRKLTVQLAEFFDRSGFLRRKGNVHILRDSTLFDG